MSIRASYDGAPKDLRVAVFGFSIRIITNFGLIFRTACTTMVRSINEILFRKVRFYADPKIKKVNSQDQRLGNLFSYLIGYFLPNPTIKEKPLFLAPRT